MAQIQPFKRLIIEDYDKKDRDLVGKLANSINVFAEDVQNAFNKKISVSDNTNVMIKDISVIVDVLGNPKTSMNVKTGLDHTCQGILVIKVTDQVTPNRPPSGTPFITFTENSGVISIINITNLVGENAYSLKILLF